MEVTWNQEKLTPLVMGCAQLGMTYGIANQKGCPCENDVLAIITKALEGGINTFDTAQGYGQSEERLGKALQKLGVLDQVNIITKLSPSLDPKNLSQIIESFEKTRSYFDGKPLWGLLLHRFNWLDSFQEGLGDWVKELKELGQIKYFGVSIYTPEEAMVALDHEAVDCIQYPYHAWDQRKESKEVLEKARSLNKLCFLRTVYLQGLLVMSKERILEKAPFAKTPFELWEKLAEEEKLEKDDLATAYVKKENFPYLIGMESVDQVERNITLLQSPPLKENVLTKIKSTFAHLDERVINPGRWKELHTS